MKKVAMAMIVGCICLLCASPSFTVWQEAKNFVLHPGYSWCHRCKKTWDVVKSHDTFYPCTDIKIRTDGPVKSVHTECGCFPLCEKCWQELKTPQARLPYYRQLFKEWQKWGGRDEADWKRIEKAVLEGK